MRDKSDVIFIVFIISILLIIFIGIGTIASLFGDMIQDHIEWSEVNQ